ncbi:MAG: MATE family efflux transporter [Defluviitaleaceae bacterium]|nr:MATE family efflux transporter [Defluviitaleaceae bacterium]
MEDNGSFIRSIIRKQGTLNILALLVSVVGPIVCTSLTGAYFGRDGLAIMALCSPLFLAASFFGSLPSGAQILCSGFIAKDELDNVDKVYSATLVVTFAVAVAVSAVLLVLKIPLLTLVAGEISPELSVYYTYFVSYAFVTMFAYIPLYFSKVVGRPEIGLLMTVTMSAVSIVASLLLIRVLGISAIALGQAIGTLVGLAASMLRLRKYFTFKMPRFKQLYLLPMLAASSPLGLSRLYMLIRTILLNALFLSLGGSGALAVYGVVAMLQRFTTAAVNGVSQTLVPLVGVFHEEQDTTSIKQTMKSVLIYGNSLLLAIGIVLCVFRYQIAAAFGLTDDKALFAYAMPFYAVYIVLLLNASVLSSYYNATRHMFLANIIPFLQELALICAGAYTLAAVFGINQIWAAFPISSAGTLVVLFAALLAVKHKNRALTIPLLQNSRLERDGRYISFSVDSQIEQASVAAERISAFCEENGVSPKQAMQISMSLEELIVLIINHNKRNNFSISVRLFLLYPLEEKTDRDGTIILRIRNAGDSFNAIEYYEKNIADDIEKSIELMGMKYIVQAANVIYYRQTFGVNSLVVLL